MNRKVRVFLFVFVALSLAGLTAALLLNLKKVKKAEKTGYPVSMAPGSTLKGVKYSGMKDGRVEWELKALSAVVSSSKDTVFLTEVDVICYEKNGVEHKLKGREGSYNEKKGELTVKGSVTLTSDKAGYTLTTEELTYVMATRVLTTEMPVKITMSKAVINGVGMRMDFEKNKLKVLKKVKAVLKGMMPGAKGAAL